MTIIFAKGDLLEQRVDAIVNTVNTVGVMGKGIALQFKKKWPINFREYYAACGRGEVRVGQMFVVDNGGLAQPQFIINFPTKQHWKGKSKIEFVESGLVDLARVIRQHKIKSIALPPLGCGNGGLSWSSVKPLILEALQDIPDLEVRLFEPESAPILRVLTPEVRPVNMTPGRAAIIKLFAAYRAMLYPLSMIEAQKLAYFLIRAGEPMSLAFVKHKFGPYADGLRHALLKMEGTYVSGVGDGTGRSEITVIPAALEAADNHLRENEISETGERVSRVKELISGFETPFGMELLATTHWVAMELGSASSVQEVVAGVHSWNERKRTIMSEGEIAKAHHRLASAGWI